MSHLIFIFLSLNLQEVWELDCDSLSEPLSQIHTAVFGPDGQIYLHDFMEAQVYLISPDGKEEKRFGRKGQGPGEWQWGTRFVYAPQQKCLFLYDAGKDVWLRFKPDGTFVDEVRDYDQEVIFPLGPGDSIRLDTKNPFETPNQGCTISFQSNDEKKVLAQFGSDEHADPVLLQRENMQLQLDMGDRSQAFVALSPNGKFLALGSTSKMKVQILDTTSFHTVATISDQIPSLPVTSDEKKERAKELNLNVNGGTMKVTAEDLNMPDFMPPIETVQMDQANRIWVRVTPAYKSKTVLFRVYDMKGDHLGSLKRPVGFHLISADSTSMWSYVHDQEEDSLILQKSELALESE